MASVQNKCLRIVSGAYRATPISVLETETFTPPLDLYLDAKLAQFRLRHKESGMEDLVKNTCLKIRNKLQRRRHWQQQQPVQTEGEARTQWAEAWIKNEHQEDLPTPKVLLSRWKQRWEAERPEWGLLGTREPGHSAVKQHAALHKAESTVITQIRTGRIGLAAFLNRARVPGVESPACQCGWAKKTAAHVIAHCPWFTGARHQIADPHTGWVDIKCLTSSPEGVHRLARWFIQLQLLPQFNLAEELLYRGGEGGSE
jgi:hypothetical protein